MCPINFRWEETYTPTTLPRSRSPHNVLHIRLVITYNIYIYRENVALKSQVWGSLTLAQLSMAKVMPHHARAPASIYVYYAIFNYCVGASGVPASVLNIVGDFLENHVSIMC